MKLKPSQPGAGAPGGVKDNFTLLTEDDLRRFGEGTHCRLYQKMGAHLTQQNGVPGVHFSVWAPNAAQVGVRGDFNAWSQNGHPLQPLGDSGVWTGFIPKLGPGSAYRFHVLSRCGDDAADKADPYGFRQETEPKTASLVWNLDYAWGDAEWMISRGPRQGLGNPISIYEVHLGSWMRVPEAGNRWLTYRELTSRLVDYVEQHGFTHVEFLPVMQHLFYGSWGYQTAGYFAPTGRHGAPQDFMHLVDVLHQRGIGVILDWVPSHFPTDPCGLGFFDGTPLYEQAPVRPGLHPEWNSYGFNFGRPEVRSFLLSSAVFWLDRYHADGLRVGGVASMLNRDFPGQPVETAPHPQGGRENPEAIGFLRQFNETVYREFPEVQTYAEELTAWPQVAHPTFLGGLGFGFKWDTGWMHDTLKYLSHDPLYRKHHHDRLTFRSLYAFTENFLLPLSHDEMVHGKSSLLERMPGDAWQKFANLRLLLAYQWAQPGKKLLFMGGEFGQWNEWNPEASLDWHLIQNGNRHNGLQKLVGHLNWLYRREPSLHAGDAAPAGFEWVNAEDPDQSTLSFLRHPPRSGESLLAVFNFTPIPRYNARVGVPRGGLWREILNSDALDYGGSGQGNQGGAEAAPFGWHGKSHALTLTLPPLGALFLKPDEERP